MKQAEAAIAVEAIRAERMPTAAQLEYLKARLNIFNY